MSHKHPDQTCHCSFCDKSQDDVKKMIRSGNPPIVYICDECVELCNDILNDNAEESAENKIELSASGVPTPHWIRSMLDRYVVGQDTAKRALAVQLHNHYKRLQDWKNSANSETVLEKSNLLLIGPTGSGKTFLIETLARILDVPFAKGDATTLTQAGYVGEDVESLLLSLLRQTGYDEKLAQRGIVYIDEIDKIRAQTGSSSSQRDPSHEGVQQALLKMLEGSTYSFAKPDSAATTPPVILDTRHILFIAGGAFNGLERIVSQRVHATSIGFNAAIGSARQHSLSELFRDATSKDLISYGFLPELVGRFPVLVPFKELDEQTLTAILTEPRNALVKQYQRLFAKDNKELAFSPGALTAIARKAMARGTGARGLRTIMEQALLDPMFDLPSRDDLAGVTVTRETIERGAKPAPIYPEPQKQ